MEPPSHILTNNTGVADALSDDPLSESVFIVMSNPSAEAEAEHFLCAYNVRTGLSYIGISGQVES